jgi:hypothetical protein
MRKPVFFLCVLALLMLPALADLTMGGDARAVAMGGAGLASGDVGANNPAILAYTGPRFGIEMPTISTRMAGTGYGDIYQLLGHPTLSGAKALSLVRDLANEAPKLDISASTGLLLPMADLQLSAALHAETGANSSYKAWVAGGKVGPAPAGAQADITAGGITTLPGIGLGMPMPINPARGSLAVGVRLKPTTAYYTHYVVDTAALAAGSPALAPEMNGRTSLRQSSFSADAGLLFTPAKNQNFHAALMVQNLIEPRAINFGPSAGIANRQLAPRSISGGLALVNERITLAADLVDLTAAYGPAQLRLGGEMRLTPALALRGGYNTATGFTGGLGLGTLGIAYSQRAPVMLSNSVAF